MGYTNKPRNAHEVNRAIIDTYVSAAGPVKIDEIINQVRGMSHASKVTVLLQMMRDGHLSLDVDSKTVSRA